MRNSAPSNIQIRPIKNDDDLNDTLAIIDHLWGAAPDTLEGDKLDVLITLVEAYEDKHHAIDAPDAITAIKFRMEQLELSRSDLEPYIGTRARVSEILNGKRTLTIPMIRNLHEHLEIPLEALIK